MILTRRRFLVRAGLVMAAAPFVVRASSLMKIVAPRPIAFVRHPLTLPLRSISFVEDMGSDWVDLRVEGFDQWGNPMTEFVRAPLITQFYSPPTA